MADQVTATRDPAAELAELALKVVFGGTVPDSTLVALADGLAAIIRPVVADGIADACNWQAAQAPPGHGMDHNGGQVVGFLGAASIAMRHRTVPPAAVNQTSLNASMLRGERQERERIAYQITHALRPCEERRIALEVVRDRYFTLTRTDPKD